MTEIKAPAPPAPAGTSCVALKMSDSEHINPNQAFMALDGSSDLSMSESSFLPLGVQEVLSSMGEGTASSEQLNLLASWEGTLVAEADTFSGMSQDLLMDTRMADLNGNGLGMTHNASQSSGIRSPSSSTNIQGLFGTDNASSDATDRLVHAIERLSTKASDFETLHRSIKSKLDEFSSRLDRTDSQLDSLNNKVDSLEGKLKILDGLLLEVIRREQMAMQELGALASRYHGNDS